MNIYDYIWLISACMWLYVIVNDYTWLYDCICMALLVLQWPIDHSTANYWWIVPMPGDGSCATSIWQPPAACPCRGPHSIPWPYWCTEFGGTRLFWIFLQKPQVCLWFEPAGGFLMIRFAIFDLFDLIAPNWTIATHCYQPIMLYCWLYMVSSYVSLFKIR